MNEERIAKIIAICIMVFYIFVMLFPPTSPFTVCEFTFIGGYVSPPNCGVTFDGFYFILLMMIGCVRLGSNLTEEGISLGVVS